MKEGEGGGDLSRIQKSLRSVKMRSHVATKAPGSSVQSCAHQGERDVCVYEYMCQCVHACRHMCKKK